MSLNQEPCSPLDWDVAIGFLSRLASEAMAASTEKKQVAMVRYHLGFSIAIYTGLRAGDILNLKWSSLIIGSHVRTSFKSVHQKTDKSGFIEINAALSNIIRTAFKLIAPYSCDEYILRSPNGQHLSLRMYNKFLAENLKKQGIVTENASSHTLRKTFAKRVWQSYNCSEHGLILLSKIFRHDSLNTTMEYIGITSTEIKNVYLNI